MDLLPDDEIHVWLADPEAMRSPECLERLLGVLGPLERDRHQRLRREQPRREFLVAHALARLVLSRYARVPAESLSFCFGEHGRPELSSPPDARWLRFNLSHTRGMAVCAVVREVDIGVDVESAARRVRHREVAERFFGEDEVKALEALAPEERAGRFLELWTLKEAYLKARGSGISIPLRSFQLRVSDQGPPRIRFDPAVLCDDASSWQLSLHHPSRTHTLALAIRRPDRRRMAVRFFEGIPG